MHHGNDEAEIRNALSGFPENLGATGQFPGGKYTKEDEGEIQFAIAADPVKRKVIINWGKPVAWVGMDPEQAHQLAAILKEKAADAQGTIRVAGRAPSGTIQGGQ